MKVLKWVGITFGIYIALVVTFEALIGYFQPSNAATLSLTVYEEGGSPHTRVLSRIEHSDNLYVAVNHWPRSWFYSLQENPEVRVAFGEKDFAATAVVVDDAAEHARIDADRPLVPWFRFLTGFPPRYFVRLEAAGV